MNLNDYIATGILESYVMNELSAKESDQVTRLAEQFPEIRKEISQIEATLIALAETNKRKVNSSVKDKILTVIESQEKEETLTFSINSWRVAASVSIIISFISLSMWWSSSTQLEDANQQISDLVNSQTQVAETLEQTYQTLQKTEGQLATVTNQSTIQVKLQGRPTSPQAEVIVYWNPSDETVFLSSINLPPLSKDEVFQLWYLIDGEPFNAGLLTLKNALQEMNKVPNAQAFAITIEPAGGSQSPTLERMIVLGSIS